MRQIWKYELNTSTRLELPANAKIMSVGMQRDIPCLWAMVDPEILPVMEFRSIEIYGTGHNIPTHVANKLKFLGTVLTSDHEFVWHIFEFKESK